MTMLEPLRRNRDRLERELRENMNINSVRSLAINEAVSGNTGEFKKHFMEYVEFGNGEESGYQWLNDECMEFWIVCGEIAREEREQYESAFKNAA